jgi:hypothetical protein
VRELKGKYLRKTVLSLDQDDQTFHCDEALQQLYSSSQICPPDAYLSFEGALQIRLVMEAIWGPQSHVLPYDGDEPRLLTLRCYAGVLRLSAFRSLLK